MKRIQSIQCASASSDVKKGSSASAVVLPVTELLEVRRLFDHVVEGTAEADRIKVTWHQFDETLDATVNDQLVWAVPLAQWSGLLIVNGLGGDDSISLGTAYFVQNNNTILIATSVMGGDGADFIQGSWGTDSIWGGDGLDELDGNQGGDEIHGDGVGDWITGGIGNDTLFGEAGNDTIWGDVGNDDVDGGINNDLLIGDVDMYSDTPNDGDDTLEGADGNDTLLGCGGYDIMFGSGDNDTLYGGGGTDFMHGGSGNDYFVTIDGEYDEAIGDTGDDACYSYDLWDYVDVEHK